MPKYMIEFDHAIDTCDRCPVCLLNKNTGQCNCILSPREDGPAFRTITVYYSDDEIRKPDWCPLSEVTNDLLMDTSLDLMAESLARKGSS